MSSDKPAKKRKLPELPRLEMRPGEAEATRGVVRNIVRGPAGGYPQTTPADIQPPPVDIKQSTPPAPADIKQSTPPESGYPPDAPPDIHKPKDRHDKNRTPFFARIAPEVATRIGVFCAEHKLDKQDFLERAAIHFIEQVDIHKGEGADILISHDDRRKTMWKTSSSIVNLYLQLLPDNRWKARDDREAEKYNGVDLRAVELGMLAALIRTEHPRIHSFKYFVEEIEEVLAVPLSDETLDLMLKRRRAQWRAKREGSNVI